MKKKLTCLMLCLAFVLVSLTGCGEEPATVESLVQDIKENTTECKSAALNMDMDFSLVVSVPEVGQSMTMNLNGEFDTKRYDNVESAICDLTLDMAGESENIQFEMYVQATDDGGELYVHDTSTDSWYKMEYEAASMIVTDLTDVQDKLTLAEETEEIDGTECYVMTGTLNGEDLMNVLKNSEDEEDVNSAKEIEDALAELEQMLGIQFDLKNLVADFKICVDKKTKLPVSYSVDLGDTDISAFNSLMTALVQTQTELSLESAVIEMTYSDFDEVEKFELPKDAKNAQEITEDDLGTLLAE